MLTEQHDEGLSWFSSQDYEQLRRPLGSITRGLSSCVEHTCLILGGRETPMKKLGPNGIRWYLSVSVTAGLMSSAGNAQTFPDFGYLPPADWTQETFKLSQAYPTRPPLPTSLPWESIDFRTEPEKYLWAILRYSYEGNIEVNFEVEKNTKRGWFHAPWLHLGANGREFVRGLTRERSSRPFELASTQSQQYRNYAVGFYDARGGYTIGRVWQQPTTPDPTLASFPEGTTTFKLLFTTAPESAIPFLAGSPEWIADIDRASSAQQVLESKVRLLQIDVAVKDKRSLKGGWVFGTFHYDSSISDDNPWLRLRPLSLMWGDDPTHTSSDYAEGKRPTESWVNALSPIVAYRTNPPVGVTPPNTMGWAGRANGPVDNPVSSCISCHGTAQIPATSPMIPPAGTMDADKLRWFRNMKEGDAFDVGSVSLDFSLQLGVGIQNLQEYQNSVKNLGGVYSHKLEVLTPRPRENYRFSRDPD